MKSNQKYIPTAWKQQWQKPMFSFYDYVPSKYEATKREEQIRRLIWDFKDGKRNKEIAAIVANKIQEKFGCTAESLVFVCLPASSADKTENRYKEFSADVAHLSGCIDGYKAVKVEGGRMAIHETKKGKKLQNLEIITLNANFFNGKRVLIFDDILTQGYSYARFACALEQLGAEVLGGYFLGKTVWGYTNNNN